jgi:hypothetical protein
MSGPDVSRAILRTSRTIVQFTHLNLTRGRGVSLQLLSGLRANIVDVLIVRLHGLQALTCLTFGENLTIQKHVLQSYLLIIGQTET